MDKQELQAALKELRIARDNIDRAIASLNDLLHMPTAQDLTLRLASLEGWAEMEKYMSKREAQ